jgi:hypothetical protein
MKKIILFTCFVCLLISFILPFKESKAIPAFGRKYQLSCQTCHSPVMPALKPFGDEFAGNGFRLSDYESPRYFVETGDPKLSLLREFPIAVRFDGHFSFNNLGQNKSDFGLPYGLKLMSGGELSKKLSYYFYFYVDERGKVAGVEDAFLMYHDLLGTGINLYAGQFQVSDPLYKRELRLSLEDYHIYTVAPGTSSINLTYDRGILIEYDLPFGTGIVAEVVNGNGRKMAGAGPLFDKDKYKNFLLKISQPIGDYLELGFFGYFGKEELQETAPALINQASLYGPNLSFTANEILSVNLQYIRRYDSNVQLTPSLYVKDMTTHGGFAEAIFSPKGDAGNWYFTGLLNWVESDFSELDYKSATLHTGYLIQRNVRLVGEYTYQFAGKEYGRLSLGFVSAF